MLFSECFYEIIRRWKDWWSKHQNHHNLSAFKPSSDQHMTEQAISCIFIIGFDLKRFQKSPDRPDDLLTLFVFDQTVFNRNDPVCLRFIGSGYDISLSVPVEYGVYFISVIIRILHSDDRFYFSVFWQQSVHHFLLLFQLLLIWHSLILASSAFFCHFTGFRFCLFFLFFHFLPSLLFSFFSQKRSSILSRYNSSLTWRW